MSAGWNKTCTVAMGAGVNIIKYRSTKTGLRVVLLEYDSPVVEGFFALATEANDDDGCPHTLEHLVFLGSEKFPYKGVLDSLANRSLAQGTNAWTDIDHTAYTITCAGSEGFLNMLPVYLDHILYATITAEGCHTEVHHVNGEGVDAGVVYCEMQGRENTCDSLANRALLLNLFPNCGICAETGGIMANLRGQSVQKIRDYHRDYYRPDNLCVVIGGRVDAADVFRALEPVEASILSKPALTPMVRPWTTAVPPFTESKTVNIQFPDDNEDSGKVVWAARGCPYSDTETSVALSVLLDYLADTSVSPLMEALVEIPEPVCSEITTEQMSFPVGAFAFEFQNVELEALETVHEKFTEVINNVMAKSLNMERMKSVVERARLQFLSSLETHPGHTCVRFVINDFLYSNHDEDLNRSAKRGEILAALQTRPETYWKDLIQRFILGNPAVTVVAAPSTALAEKMRADEDARLAQQKAKLGDAGLKLMQEKVDHANEVNNRPIPQELLEGFPIPNVSRVSFIPVVTVSNGAPVPADSAPAQALAAKLAAHAAGRNSSAFTQYDHIDSAFYYVRCLFDTSDLPDNLRPYLPLFNAALFESAVTRDGAVIPHDVVIQAIADNTVSSHSCVGLSSSSFRTGAFGQLQLAVINCEASKYEESVKLLQEQLWSAHDTVARLQVWCAKLASSIADEKRGGEAMVAAAAGQLVLDPIKSNDGAVNMFRQERFLEKLAERLESEPDAVLAEFTALRKHVTGREHMRVQVIGNIADRPQVQDKWLSAAGVAAAAIPRPVPYVQSLRGPEGVRPTGKGVLLPLGAVESAYAVQVRPGLDRFDHPDSAPLEVLIEYLTTMEGPFWKQIRGLGFSYGYGISSDEEKGNLTFQLRRATDSGKAAAAATGIIKAFANGSTPLQRAQIDAARCGAMYGVISKEDTKIQAAKTAFANLHLRRVPYDFTQQYLRQLQAVTEDDVKRVLQQYLVPLFDVAQTTLVVVANPLKTQEIQAAFAAAGRTLTVVEDADAFFV